MKYDIGDIVQDADGNTGIVVIKWNDGDTCVLENDAAHPLPTIITNIIKNQKDLPPEFQKTVDENFWELIK